jgi:hypothetical protein
VGKWASFLSVISSCRLNKQSDAGKKKFFEKGIAPFTVDWQLYPP